MSAKSQPPALVVTFRPDFCSPAYLNGLLRLQHLHWLEIHRRAGDGAVTAFQFVIPASLANLVCVLATEVPFLEAELGCRVRQIPVPDFVAPDGLKAFGVHYATTERAPGHARFLAALRAVCVRLQLTNICVDPPAPADGDGRAGGVGGGCAACAKMSTHTKSVRGAGIARPRRRPPLMLDLARQRTRRPASVEAAAADADKKAAAATAVAAAAEAVEEMAEAAAASLQGRLSVTEAAMDAAALVATAASAALGVVCSGSLDRRLACAVADAVVARERLRADVVDVFAGWAAELAGRLLTGCVRLTADGVAAAAVAAARVADTTAGRLLCDLADKVAAELAESELTMVRVSLPCDWRTSRSLLGLQPVRRRCPNCGASVTAEPAGASGYRLTVRSRGGRRCSRHASLLQLADCARSSKDAKLGGLLLQEVAALPSGA